ncbi:hypothetical protein BJ508DRAFT_306389 [Ascobolus immersus RN42]|uniref:Subtilisin-like protein n=1 Tax=Ascobolus immersus RN42 TaxID=1160509 RepID=A0A3N4IIT3_ASCIM|nr:hypothetical protein BJ508DRAFT_306389 [Ascobolus immersus RN42]
MPSDQVDHLSIWHLRSSTDTHKAAYPVSSIPGAQHLSNIPSVIMDPKPPTPAASSAQPLLPASSLAEADASPFDSCRIRQEKDWFGRGLLPGESMHRTEGGPPVFGTRMSYDTALEPEESSGNPHGLMAILVRLKCGLTVQEREAHYVDLYRHSKLLDSHGLKEVCFLGEPFEKGDGLRRAARTVVDNWTTAAIGSDHWNRSVYEAGQNGGYSIRFPARLTPQIRSRFGEVLMGGGDEFLKPDGTIRVDVVQDFYPAPAGHVPLPFEGHGNACAVLAAGNTRGIIPACNIFSINLFANGQELCEEDAVHNAVQWIVQEADGRGWNNRSDVNIISVQGIGRHPQNWGSPTQGYIEDELVSSWYYGGSRGLFFRVITPILPVYPHMSPHVIVVGGMDVDGKPGLISS